MKNKKILIITTVCIACIALGIYGFSAIFEAGWSDEKEINNTLDTNRDIYQISDMGAFPYITMDEYLSLEPQRSNFYQNPPQVITVTEEMISCDEAAVIGGTAMEIINPTENFRELTFVIYPANREIKNAGGEIVTVGPVYTGFYEEKFENKSRTKKSYYYTIDAITKEVISLRYTLVENFDKGIQTLLVDNPVEYAKEIAYGLGYKNLKSYFVETGDYGNGGKAYRVDFLIDETQSITIGFNSYNDTFLFAKNNAEFSAYHSNLLENGIDLE